MLNRIGVFVNMDYAQYSDKCKPAWEKIMESMRYYGFLLPKARLCDYDGPKS